jgi:hypothetical protein
MGETSFKTFATEAGRGDSEPPKDVFGGERLSQLWSHHLSGGVESDAIEWRSLWGGREGGETKARQSPRWGNRFFESVDSRGHVLWCGVGPTERLSRGNAPTVFNPLNSKG